AKSAISKGRRFSRIKPERPCFRPCCEFLVRLLAAAAGHFSSSDHTLPLAPTHRGGRPSHPPVQCLADASDQNRAGSWSLARAAMEQRSFRLCTQLARKYRGVGSCRKDRGLRGRADFLLGRIRAGLRNDAAASLVPSSLLGDCRLRLDIRDGLHELLHLTWPGVYGLGDSRARPRLGTKFGRRSGASDLAGASPGIRAAGNRRCLCRAGRTPASAAPRVSVTYIGPLALGDAFLDPGSLF